jgi:hypothetical protein
MNIGIIPSNCIQTHATPYKLVKYPVEKKHDRDYRHFRSNIYKDDTLICYSPPKSIHPDDFFKEYDLVDCIVDEFIDGVMINAFYDGEWKISTKSIIGAQCSFESSTHTFALMFQECMAASSLTYNDLNTSWCYSFVIQHPLNKIVMQVPEPKLFIVAVYEIHDNTVCEVNNTLLCPTRYHFQTYEEILQACQTNTFKGLMIKSNGERTKVRNHQYDALSRIKGNAPFSYYYVTQLRNNAELLENYYLYFPEDRVRAEQYEFNIAECSQKLFDAYKDCFMLHKAPLKTYNYKSYLYDLHGIYLNELRPHRMTKKRVMEYINSIPSVRLNTLLRI